MYEIRGQLDEAINHYKTAINTFEELGDKRNLGIFIGNLGGALRSTGEYHQAIDHYERALRIQQQVGDKRHEGIFRGNLGEIHYLLDRNEEAKRSFSEAIAILDHIIPAAAGAFRGSLALLHAESGDLSTARQLLERGEEQVASEREEAGLFLCKKGQVQCLGKEYTSATASLDQASHLAREMAVTDNSDLAKSIAKLRQQLTQAPAPPPSSTT